MPVRSLRDAFGRSTLTRKARDEISHALAAAGVIADPSLDDVKLNDNVRLFLVESAPPPRPEAAPAPVWAPAPRQPGVWERFRAWPPWAQLAAGAAALVLVIAALSGGESSDDGGSTGDPAPAQQAGSGGTAEDDEARERERARERKRVRRKRERARERERIRERRRERKREEERERREREEEAAPPPVIEPPEEPGGSGGGEGCDPNYSGCVPQYPPDVDCPDVDGPVDVTGDDPHGLDADGDGEGCEN